MKRCTVSGLGLLLSLVLLVVVGYGGEPWDYPVGRDTLEPRGNARFQAVETYVYHSLEDLEHGPIMWNLKSCVRDGDFVFAQNDDGTAFCVINIRTGYARRFKVMETTEAENLTTYEGREIPENATVHSVRHPMVEIFKLIWRLFGLKESV